MTGYGRGESQTDDYHVLVDIKSVNHRFLDTQIRLPREYNHLELEMKNEFKQVLSRGRVECFITLTKEQASSQALNINWNVLDSLVEELSHAEFHRYQKQPFSAEKFLEGAVMHPVIVETVEKKEVLDDIERDMLQAFKQALQALNKSRQKEGEGLRQFFLDYLESIKKEVSSISSQVERINQEHYDKLKKKLEELMSGAEIDESRLLTEVALIVDRGDVTEELDRLSVHLQSMNQLLEKEGPIGKEMDFLIQEMNREVNTIGSKSADLSIKSSVIQLKTLIEQIREQVQNIE